MLFFGISRPPGPSGWCPSVAFDRQDVAIVRSIIDLGHNLGYKVIAEGVENNMAWDILESLGCDTAQGFHISKPLDENNFSDWLTEANWAD